MPPLTLGVQGRTDGEKEALVLCVDDADLNSGKAAPAAKQGLGGYEHILKYSALFLLVFQNSGLFVLTRYTRVTDGPMYLSTVVVLLTEVAKLVFCLMCGLIVIFPLHFGVSVHCPVLISIFGALTGWYAVTV